MLFGSCLGTVTSLTVMMTTLLTIMQDPVGMVEGLLYCKGVSAWFGCLWHSFFTHNLCWATAKKGQGFARLSIGVVPELCLFYQPRSIFLCAVNFFTSCNNFSDYIVPVQHVLLLVRIFSDMYICSLGNISLHFEFFYVLLNKNLHSEFSIFLSSFLKCITSHNLTFLWKIFSAYCTDKVMCRKTGTWDLTVIVPGAGFPTCHFLSNHLRYFKKILATDSWYKH